jgi:hypothetical protein
MYLLSLAHEFPVLSVSVTKMVFLSPTSPRMLTDLMLTVSMSDGRGYVWFLYQSFWIVYFDLQVPAETAGTLTTSNWKRQTLLLKVIFSMMLDTRVSPTTCPRVPGSVCISD